MKYLIALVLLVSCSVSRPPEPQPLPTPIPAPVPNITPKPKPIPVPEAPINAVDDWSPFFQHEIDSCIANTIPVYVIPAGHYMCKEPLILARYPANATYYVPFTLTLVGESAYAGLDGSGTILDFSSMTDGFGIGFQGAKGGGIYGIKLIGAWHYAFPGASQFYNSSLSSFTDGRCRDTRYSPYFAVVIDPFGPGVPSDGGYPGLSSYYKGQRNGSTGVTIDQCFFTNWVGGIITSPNGYTQNAELLIADKIQFANMKICVAGCQDQEKMNRVSNVMEWGVVHTCFATGYYGAGSIGNWYFDHWNIAGYTNEFAYNNQGGYSPSYFSDIFAESLGRIGFIASGNGTTFSNSTINFAGYKEAGSYTSDMISGFGVTFIGCQLRLYGQYSPITIWTGSGSNMMHFRDCSFDAVPIYPQSYGGGYSDFQNCNVGEHYSILNPLGPQTARVPVQAYGQGSTIAAKAVLIDGRGHQLLKSGANFSSVVQSDSAVKVMDVLLASTNGEFKDVAGIVTAVGIGNFTISYSPISIDTTKQYYLYKWKTILK